jgi:hypothetical protein
MHVRAGGFVNSLSILQILPPPHVYAYQGRKGTPLIGVVPRAQQATHGRSLSVPLQSVADRLRLHLRGRLANNQTVCYSRRASTSKVSNFEAALLLHPAPSVFTFSPFTAQTSGDMAKRMLLVRGRRPLCHSHGHSHGKVLFCLCLCLGAHSLSTAPTTIQHQESISVRVARPGCKEGSPTGQVLRAAVRVQGLCLRGGGGAVEAEEVAMAAGPVGFPALIAGYFSAAANMVSTAVASCFGGGGQSSYSNHTGARCDSIDGFEMAGNNPPGSESTPFVYDAADVSKGDEPFQLGLRHAPGGIESKDIHLPAYEVLLDCLPAGAPADRVQVVLHRKYCRLRQEDIEKGIEAEWRHLTLQHPRMWWYDGTLFRLASSQRWLDVDGTQEVKLECGITRYRSFLGTNMAPNWDKIPQAHMSNALSCFVLVHTVDRYIMLVSHPHPEGPADQSSESYLLPGGHMSADRAGIFDSMVQVPIPDQDGQEVTCMLDYSIWPGSEKWRPASVERKRPYKNVVSELFTSPVRIACADLGLRPSHLVDKPLLFGITQGRKNRIMSAVFYLATNLTSEEVKEERAQQVSNHSLAFSRCASRIGDREHARGYRVYSMGHGVCGAGYRVQV